MITIMIDDGDEDGDEEDANILLTDFSFWNKLPTGARQEHIGDGHCFHCQGFTFSSYFFSKIFMILLKIDLDNLFQLCLLQAMQMITKLNKMVEAGMAEKVNVVVMILILVMILMIVILIWKCFSLGRQTSSSPSLKIQSPVKTSRTTSWEENGRFPFSLFKANISNAFLLHSLHSFLSFSHFSLFFLLVSFCLLSFASQQGGRGEVEKPDRRCQGGDGGEMGRAGILGARKGNGSNSINIKIVI